jgi:hypothetical protein
MSMQENGNTAGEETNGLLSRRKFVLGLAATTLGTVDLTIASVHNHSIEDNARRQVRDQLGDKKPYKEVEKAMDDAGRKALAQNSQPGVGRLILDAAAILGGGYLGLKG